MNEGLLAKHAHMNAAAIPPSAEDLAQKHQALLQEYSRLKAKHTVLKKATLKEQANKAVLQNNVKEKEKELRKLQEQLDLLSFHNERLTKRIEAVQGTEQKGSHFSLLGGSVKKELERSTQALDAMNEDLTKKIEENERLHDELSENHHIYTGHVNELHQTIATLEKRVEELEIELSTYQKDSREKSSALKNEKAALQSQIDTLKKELQEKNGALKENEKTMVQGDAGLQSEIESLRALLLAKAGAVECREDDDTDIPKLNDVIPACDALKVLEEQARNYIYALREQTTLKGLPHEIAAKLKTSSETWSEEVQNLAKRLEESEARAKKLLEVSETEKAEMSEQVATLQKSIENLKEELNQRQEVEQTEHLERANRELEQRNKELNERNAELEAAVKRQESDLTDVRQQLEQSQAMNKTLQKELVDKETQADLVTPAEADAPAKDTSDDDDDAVFIYRSSSESANVPNEEAEDEAEDEDEEHFVYTGADAPKEIEIADKEQPAEAISTSSLPSNHQQPPVHEKHTQTDNHPVPRDEKQTQTDAEQPSKFLDEETQTDAEQPSATLDEETQTDAEKPTAFLDEETQTDAEKPTAFLDEETQTDAEQPSATLDEETQTDAERPTSTLDEETQTDGGKPSTFLDEETQTDAEQPSASLDEETQTDPMAPLDEKQTQTDRMASLDEKQTQTDKQIGDAANNASPATAESADPNAQQAAMEEYYESRLNQLNEKLELADSKALRFSQMVEVLKERLAAETEQRSRVEQENELLQKEVHKVKEHLETTEKNYQDQMAMMTENFLTQLNQQEPR